MNVLIIIGVVTVCCLAACAVASLVAFNCGYHKGFDDAIKFQW